MRGALKMTPGERPPDNKLLFFRRILADFLRREDQVIRANNSYQFKSKKKRQSETKSAEKVTECQEDPSQRFRYQHATEIYGGSWSDGQLHSDSMTTPGNRNDNNVSYCKV